MSKHMPPSPPEQQAPHGGGSQPKDQDPPAKQARDLDQQGRQGNIRQNTTNQGYQQDR